MPPSPPHAARLDPVAAPPGQSEVYKSIPGDKGLYVLDVGHFGRPGRARQERQLRSKVRTFFAPL